MDRFFLVSFCIWREVSKRRDEKMYERIYGERKKRIYVSQRSEINLALTSLASNKLDKDMQRRRSGRCSDVDAWYQPYPRHRTWTWLWPLSFACFLFVSAVHILARATWGWRLRVSSVCVLSFTHGCVYMCVSSRLPLIVSLLHWLIRLRLSAAVSSFCMGHSLPDTAWYTHGGFWGGFFDPLC